MTGRRSHGRLSALNGVVHQGTLHRTVVVRMRLHQPTVDYVARRTAGGRTRREIIRCLKRFLAREIYQRVMTDYRARQADIQAA